MHEAAIFSFPPNPARAALLDRRVRSMLAGSLQVIFANSEGALLIDAPAARQLLQAIRAHRVSPGVFGLYSDLVVAIFDDAIGEAQRVIDTLMQASWQNAASFRIATLDDEDLGAGQAARYARLLDDDPTIRFPLGPVTPAQREKSIALLQSTMHMLKRAAPLLAGEFRELVRELVLVESRPDRADKDALSFDGASIFHLWGALFLNAARHADRVDLATALAHESAHSHLFGVTLGAPLVENGEDERYASPLRYDPRPMDGLVHATYVLARMVWCLNHLIPSGVLLPEELEAASAKLVHYRRDYRAGLAVVSEHARFTPVGRAVFESAMAYMDGNIH